MNTLITGSRISTGKGHITETITENKLSINFDHCRFDTIYLRIEQYHMHCIQVAIKKNNPIKPLITNEYILDCIKSILFTVNQTSNHSQFQSIVIVSTFHHNDKNYLKHIISVPYYPENFHIIELL